MSDSTPEISLEALIPADWKAPGSPKTLADLVANTRKLQSEKDTLLMQKADAESRTMPEFKTTQEIEKHFASMYSKHYEDGNKAFTELAHKTFGGEDKFKEFTARAEKAGFTQDLISLMDEKELKSLDAVLVGKADADNNTLPDGGEKPETKKNENIDKNYVVKFGEDEFYAEPTREGIQKFATQRVIDPETKKEALLIDVSPQASAMYDKAMKDGINTGAIGPVTNTNVRFGNDGTITAEKTTGDVIAENLNK